MRKREGFHLLDDDVDGAEQARRVMKGYEAQLDERERRVLLLLGLFDRPADAAALAALRAEPEVEGLTVGIGAGEEKAWKAALARLRRARLLLEAEGEAAGATEELDAHPLVREHFGEQLQETAPEAWREGHRRLFEHYRNATVELPDNLPEMLPLYTAVVHGCRAGLAQEALDEVFWKRIYRGGEFYSSRKLGAYSSELTALAALFERPWDRPAATLADTDQAFLLNQAAFTLRTLGRLPEAVVPMEGGLQRRIEQKDWKNAAASASNLSELHLTLGQVTEAVEAGERGVELAEHSGDLFQRLVERTTHADALHQAGERQAAEARFVEAEALQAELQPQSPRLYSLRGYQYCDLLLAPHLDLLLAGQRAAGAGVPETGAGSAPAAAPEEVRERAEEWLAWRVPNDPQLDIALIDLTLGRVHLVLDETDAAQTQLTQAVEGLRQAGTEHRLPWGLLARATLHLRTQRLDAARHDLDEALEIAQRGSMRLHEADALLGFAWWHLARGNGEAARGCVARARGIVEETGYGRRLGEVEVLEGRVG